jgi:nitrate/nitrite transporter NarK
LADFNLDNTSIGLLIALPTLLGALMRADGTSHSRNW